MTKNTGAEFIQKTKYEHLTPSQQSQNLPQPPLELPVEPETQRIPLPKPDQIHFPPIDLRTAMARRRTQRQYSSKPLTPDELSFLLWYTQGIQSISQRPSTYRCVPSAGARHAFETFLLINRVDDITPGLYRFFASEHALIEINLSPQIKEDITHACLHQKQIMESAVTFIWVAVVERMVWRYSERAYRYLFLDAGHICQNLYLAAEAIQCGVCAIAAFNDDEINNCLELDGENLLVLYLGALGKKSI